ncbi:GNAT family N-acetyltransferase [Deinococcus sp.]|uniref:GNAT family N-acetyltransferase n=1 Tax=Deinococcus sp. TaxID=47478 RepID=UPI0025FC8C0F|nr:GNAT family N-acetyltransferase [Deinococcus sp.]
MTSPRASAFAPAIRVLHAADAPAYRELRLRALRGEASAYLTSAEEYEARTLGAVAERLAPTPGCLTLGAFVSAEPTPTGPTGTPLVAIATLARSSAPRHRHRAEVFAVYVAPEVRGLKLGRSLMSALIVQARAMPELEVFGLSVTSTQLAARRLYERLGFTVWGEEPDSLKLGERRLSALHMQLRL